MEQRSTTAGVADEEDRLADVDLPQAREQDLVEEEAQGREAGYDREHEKERDKESSAILRIRLRKGKANHPKIHCEIEVEEHRVPVAMEFLTGAHRSAFQR